VLHVPSQAYLQLPALHDALHVAPSSHWSEQLPPSQVRLHVVPDAHSDVQCPPLHVALHVAPVGQEKAQSPSSHSALQIPSLHVYPFATGGTEPASLPAPPMPQS
jgi:hypothetical protein